MASRQNKAGGEEDAAAPHFQGRNIDGNHDCGGVAVGLVAFANPLKQVPILEGHELQLFPGAETSQSQDFITLALTGGGVITRHARTG